MRTSIDILRTASNLIQGMRPRVRLRVAGALLGGSLSLAAADLSQWLNLYWSQWFGPLIPTLGILVGIVLGFAIAPGAVRTPHPEVWVVGMAGLAAMLGVAVLLASWVVGNPQVGGDSGTSLPTLILAAVLYAIAGLILGLPVTFPIALVATGILRLGTHSRRAGIAAGAAACLLAIASLGLSFTGRLPILPSSPRGEPVQLQVIIVNLSNRPLELGAYDRDGGGVGGAVFDVEPCFTTVESFGVGKDWFLTPDPMSGSMSPPELISAADVPGQTPLVRLTIQPDGTSQAAVAQGLPSDTELTVDHCLEPPAQ
jgi:hypothetical protein